MKTYLHSPPHDVNNSLKNHEHRSVNVETTRFFSRSYRSSRILIYLRTGSFHDNLKRFAGWAEIWRVNGERCMQAYLTEPDVTKNGIGVGHGFNGELLTELRVLLNTECGHCGGPTCAPAVALPPLLEERPFRQGIFDQPLTSFPDTPANKYVDQPRLLSTVAISLN